MLLQSRNVNLPPAGPGVRPTAERTDGEAIRIAVTYDGLLQLPDPLTMKDLHHKAKKAVAASAYVIPFFETDHPKYHWLSEQASVAFGTWRLENGVVTASYDVYSAD